MVAREQCLQFIHGWGKSNVASKRIIIILFIPIYFSPKSSTQVKRLRNIHNIPKLRHTLKSDTDLQVFLSRMKVFYSEFLLFANSVVRKLLWVQSSQAFIVRSPCSIQPCGHLPLYKRWHGINYHELYALYLQETHLFSTLVPYRHRPICLQQGQGQGQYKTFTIKLD